MNFIFYLLSNFEIHLEKIFIFISQDLWFGYRTPNKIINFALFYQSLLVLIIVLSVRLIGKKGLKYHRGFFSSSFCGHRTISIGLFKKCYSEK